MNKPAALLTIAGSDGSAGAGVQSDLLTFYDLDLKGICVITSLVSQTPQQTISVEKRSGKLIKQELDLFINFYDIKAIKIGLINSLDQLIIIQEFISSFKTMYPHRPIVLDPVGTASTGFHMQDDNLNLSNLFNHCTLITPNLSEALLYLDNHTSIDNLAELQKATQSLQKQFDCDILIKGGHLNGESIYDVYANSTVLHTFTHVPINGLTQWHGTGCKLSSAITGYLSLDYPMIKAIEAAQLKLVNDFKNKY